MNEKLRIVNFDVGTPSLTPDRGQRFRYLEFCSLRELGDDLKPYTLGDRKFRACGSRARIYPQRDGIDIFATGHNRTRLSTTVTTPTYNERINSGFLVGQPNVNDQ